VLFFSGQDIELWDEIKDKIHNVLVDAAPKCSETQELKDFIQQIHASGTRILYLLEPLIYP
jgi:hypothetical protein